MKKILVSLIIISWIIFTWYAAYTNLVWSKSNSDAGWSGNDIWNFWWNYTYSDPLGTNWWLVAKLVWEIDSTLFWKFYFWTWTSTTPIKFNIFPGSNLCWAWNTVFKITWTVKPANLAWADMSFTWDSYYCPWTNSWSWTLYSDLLGYKQIWKTNTLVNPAGWAWWTWIWAIFNNDSLVVQWIVWKWVNNSFNIWNTVNTANQNTQQSVSVDVWVNKGGLDLLVNKNISLLTKTLPLDITNPINSLTNKNIYYYNFEWQHWYISNENNSWVILKIWNTNYTDANRANYQVWVQWYKTIIVKWWNIYINADIYNQNDSSSLLVLVAKRDPTNRANGWNIYINPHVTNIDAVMIADWSIINYDDTKLPPVITNSWSLMKQLFIYGSLYTKNIIGQSALTYNPYWSDWYIKYWKTSKSWINKYDLTKLRHFSLVLSPSTWNCNSNFNYLVPRQNLVSTWAIMYAWAWKRKCFNEPLRNPPYSVNPVVNHLRWTNKFNSVIIKYNPAVKTNPPKILLK